MHIHIYIYIYIQRERERDGERGALGPRGGGVARLRHRQGLGRGEVGDAHSISY